MNSLEVRGFRTFRDLRIERLGRVNLIVGKNNVGKSSLLEALRLYADAASPSLVWELLTARDEANRDTSVTDGEGREFAQAVRNLFYGRPDLTDKLGPIRIGQIDSPSKTLSISVELHQGLREVILRQEAPADAEDLGLTERPFLLVQLGNQRRRSYPLDADVVRRVSLRRETREISSTFIPANGLSKRQVSTLWNKMTEADREDDMVRALNIIAPEVRRLSLLVDQQRAGEHVPVVKIDGFEKLVPLRSMGEGMNRLFSIALTLVGAQEGLLLVDEIESGLHYSIQADMWRLIFGAAQTFNIQVFATTHSWDCLKGFRKAAVENGEVEGLVIRLQRRKEDITATLFDEHEIAVATRNQIEVR